MTKRPMECSACGVQNRDDSRFCLQCGTRLRHQCSSCRRELPAGARFCDGCGEALSAGAGRDSTPLVAVPGHLVDRVLRSRTALEGERKRVTVLFADLKGSLELLADRDPEEARDLLDGVVERMMEAVHRYEGTVNQVMGDGIMALFGAPLAVEDHAVRACYAALRMQSAVGGYAEEVHRSLGVPVHIRVGLNSGEVVVRSIGSDLKMDYTAVGQTTHLAARMEQMAMPGTILLAPGTLREAEGYVVARSLGPRTVKGLEAPIEVFELCGATTVRSRLQATAARGLTPFVGRDPEIDALGGALERAAGGAGQLVAVVGEAGVGKSRLFWEFTHSHRTQGWRVVEGRSVSYGKANAYLPLVELLKAYFGIEGGDEPRAIREKTTGKLLALDRALEPYLTAILWVLGLPAPQSDGHAADPALLRRQAFEGIRALLLRESEVQPLIVIFEDLHWIDAETQALLDALVDGLAQARLLLLVNYRPEYGHGWAAKSYYRQLRLTPLAPASLETLLGSLLGDSPDLEPLRRLVRERTDGNPFFVEETIRALVEAGALAGERGAYRLDRPLERVQIPATAEAILATRIDRLNRDDKRLLQAAAVIGKDVPFSVLHALMGGDDDGLRASLARLQDAEFLYELQLFPELEYTFRHALGREVAYRSLLQERRRALHTRVVEVIEKLYGDRLAEHVHRLAEHALEGQAWEKAFPYLLEAGRRSVSLSSNREAAACFERALEVLEHLPEETRSGTVEVDLRLEVATAWFPLGELERAQLHLMRAEEIARTIGDRRRLAQVSTVLANYFWAAGEPARALELAERALVEADAVADETMLLVARFRLGQAFHSLGDYGQAIAALRHCVAGIGADRVEEKFGLQFILSVGARTWLAWCLAEVGAFEEAARLAEEAVRIADAANHPLSRIVGRHGLGFALLRRGEFLEAARILDQALELCRSWNVRSWSPRVASALAYACGFCNRVTESQRLFVESELESASMRTRLFRALRRTWQSEVCWLQGDLDGAEQAAREALDVAQGQKERGSEAWALRMCGEVVLARGGSADAATWFHRAIEIADELGMSPLSAHCHLGLGRVFRAVSQEQASSREIQAAATLFAARGMRHWLAHADGLRP